MNNRDRTRLSFAVMLLALLFWAFLLSVSPAEVTLTATTWPPGQKMGPGVSVIVQVQGMEQTDAGAIQPKTKWHIIPAYPDDKTMLFMDMNRQPLLFFAGIQPGPRTIFLQIESPGLDDLPRCDFQYGEEVKPSPDPQPGPDPEPQPEPGPVSELWVIIVEETRDRTAEQAQVLLDPMMRDWLERNGHHFKLIDQDQTAADLLPWIRDVPTDSALPYCFLASGKSGKLTDVWKGPLPETKAKMLELVKKWGAEK